MDAINVFVVNGADTFGLLVPYGCNYAGLVDMIANELKVDMRRSCINIEYSADVEMSPIRIKNDSSLQFYLELKRKDPRITAYALRINLIDILQPTDYVPVLRSVEQIQFQSANINGSHLPTANLTIRNEETPNFISGIEVLALEIEDDIYEEINAVATWPDVLRNIQLPVLLRKLWNCIFNWPLALVLRVVVHPHTFGIWVHDVCSKWTATENF
ncbi:unnamed protein product [Fraxinus pennsylvanica]|uniref:Uncharacterized protein n=1 Tax=Fraxinus pennsylvanica TaxID=56036 RepID=A0AAD2EDZ2_9LAMI|nr:unnamed protein product [Fraxinus pennsylvanica]